MRTWPSGSRFSPGAGRIVWALAAAAALAAMPSGVWAQAVSPAEDPYGVVDDNNVNLITSRLSLSSHDISIGESGRGNAAPCWSDGGWNTERSGAGCSVAGGLRDLRSNVDDMGGAGLELVRYYHQGLGGTPDIVQLVGGQTNWSSSIVLDRGRYIVSFGNQTFYFAGVTQGYQSNRGDGAIMEPLGSNSFRVTTRDGTQLVYPAGYRPVNSITYANGRTISITYGQRQGCGHIGCMEYVYYRPQQITSSDNYGLLFEYASDNGTADNLPDWSKIVRVTAFNRTIDACDPAQMHCSFTRTWPAVNYTLTSTVRTITSPGGRTTTHEITNGRITRILDPDGNVAQSISYYPPTDTARQGLVLSVTRNGGTWSYNPSSAASAPNVIVTQTVTDPLGGVRVTRGTTRVGLMEVIDELTRSTTFSHDAQTRLYKITRPSGAYTINTLDARGNVTESRRVAAGYPDIVTSAIFPATCTNPETCNRPTSTTNARGHVTDYSYDAAHGGTLTMTRPPGANGVRPQLRFTYSQIGGIWRPATISSCRTLASCAGTADEMRAIFTYQPGNLLPQSVRMTSGTGSPSATYSATYDDIGNVLTATDPLLNTEYMFYEADRRVTGLISADPDGAGSLPRRAIRYVYNGAGQPTRIERGTVTAATSAALAAMIPAQAVVTSYDGQGRRAQESEQAGGTVHTLVQRSYDLAGRPQCVALRMNSATYANPPSSACSLATQGADGADRIVLTSHDAAGRPTRIQEGYLTADQGDEQQMTYTANGQLETITDGENNRTTYEYDGHDRLIKTRYPVPTRGAATSSTTDFEMLVLDAESNVTQRRLRDGQLINYSYDQLNRMTLKNLPSPENDVSYTYDLHDRPLTTTHGSATIQLGYDALGRVVSETSPRGTMSFQVDLMGRRTRTTWPDGFFVTRDYLATGELRTIRESGATSGPGVLATFNYDGLGRLTSLVRGNTTTTTYGHDAISRPNSITHNVANTAQDVTITLTHNPADQIRTHVRSNDLYAWTDHYAVDRPYTVNGLNQLTAAGTTPLTYLDQRGNLTNSGSSVFAYTVENRMISAPGGVTLTYDATGRLSATLAAATTKFQYDGSELIAEYDVNNLLVRRYVHGPTNDDPLVWYEGATNADRRWLHQDERGSVIGVSNGSGTMTTINAYDEYGIPAPDNAGRFQYTGQTWLAEAGLYYYKARMYSPTLGRYMQTDPIGYADGINWYNYVRSDPVNLTDPDGQQTDPREFQMIVDQGGPHTREAFIGAAVAPIAIAACVAGGCEVAGGALLVGMRGLLLSVAGSAAYRSMAAYISRQISWHINRGIRNGLVNAIRTQVQRGIRVGGRDHVAKAHNTLGWIRNTIRNINRNPNMSRMEKNRLIDRLERLRRQIEDALHSSNRASR